MARRATSQSVKSTARCSAPARRENTKPPAQTCSVSSRLGEPDDIRSYTPVAPEIELDASFWKHAKSMPPLACKASVHLRIDRDVLDWFRDQGKGHLTRMNHVLRAYYEAQRARPKQSAARARQHRKTGRP
jgi:uncharacterized protein (DUF4415 family)